MARDDEGAAFLVMCGHGQIEHEVQTVDDALHVAALLQVDHG